MKKNKIIKEYVKYFVKLIIYILCKIEVLCVLFGIKITSLILKDFFLNENTKSFVVSYIDFIYKIGMVCGIIMIIPLVILTVLETINLIKKRSPFYYDIFPKFPKPEFPKKELLQEPDIKYRFNKGFGTIFFDIENNNKKEN